MHSHFGQSSSICRPISWFLAVNCCVCDLNLVRSEEGKLLELDTVGPWSSNLSICSSVGRAPSQPRSVTRRNPGFFRCEHITYSDSPCRTRRMVWSGQLIHRGSSRSRDRIGEPWIQLPCTKSCTKKDISRRALFHHGTAMEDEIRAHHGCLTGHRARTIPRNHTNPWTFRVLSSKGGIWRSACQTVAAG